MVYLHFYSEMGSMLSEIRTWRYRYQHVCREVSIDLTNCIPGYTLTLLFFVSFHNKLKCNPAYLNCRVNKRVDYLLNVLLRIEEDMFFDRQRKNLKWKVNRREQNEHKRHNTGMKIPSCDVKVLYCVVISRQILCMIIPYTATVHSKHVESSQPN